MSICCTRVIIDNCADCGARRTKTDNCKKGWRWSWHMWDGPIYEAKQQWSFEGRNSGDAVELWFNFCLSLKYKIYIFWIHELVKRYKYEILTQAHSREFIKLDSRFWIYLFIW